MGVYSCLKAIYQRINAKLKGDLRWVKDNNGMLTHLFKNSEFKRNHNNAKQVIIEEIATKVGALGDFPLWEGFEKLDDYPFPVKNASRNPSQVRISKKTGEIIYYITTVLKPSIVLEIGSAFGISGMYWLSGLKDAGRGRLVTFEPNKIWAKIARENLSKIHVAYKLVEGTFEENHLEEFTKGGESIDIGFIDAIHVGSVVKNQFELVTSHSRSGSLIIFDDINFSKDMASCWNSIATDRRVKASCSFFGRLGIVELA